MSKKKIEKRYPDGIGKKQFDFDFQLEKDIYSYLNGIRMKRKSRKKLKEQFRFCYFSDWENYIQKKYSSYDNKRLKDFSIFLNQKIRREKPNQEFWKICIPIIVSLMFSKFIEMLWEASEMKFSDFSIFLITYLLLCLTAIFFSGLFFKFVEPIWENNTVESLLIDYKQIIDDLLKDRLTDKDKLNDTNKRKRIRK